MAFEADHMRLSARGYRGALPVGRTIADLEGSTGVGCVHVAEALSYRRACFPVDSARRTFRSRFFPAASAAKWSDWVRRFPRRATDS